MSLTKEEQRILQSIRVPSENDPDRPEFPPADPHYPSTPTKQIQVKGFEDVWLKDESVNPTGTHKDRMAWEMVVMYRELLLAKKNGRIDTLPRLSIISSGSAAVAIQSMLSKFRLPALKVLIDHSLSESRKSHLEKLGCEIFETDLSARALNTEDILRLTENEDGIDITSDDSLGPFSVFYDWMSYDILNQNAGFVFLPYGSGHLFENLVNVAKREASALFFHDKRFKGNVSNLRECHFLGATTNRADSKADKLYSPHLPFVHFDTQWIELAKKKGYIGSQSKVHVVREKYLDEAMEVAKKNKISCEPSGIAGLALMLQMKKQLPRNQKTLIVNTGKVRIKV